MQKRIRVNGVEYKDDILQLQVPNDVKLEKLKASGQMLVDSDNLAFIYMLEDNDEYLYIVLDKELWPQLKNAVNRQFKVSVRNETSELALLSIHDEMNYLIENIKGNGNYGDEMVQLVEQNFF